MICTNCGDDSAEVREGRKGHVLHVCINCNHIDELEDDDFGEGDMR